MPAAASQRRTLLVAAAIAYTAVFGAFVLIPADVGLGHLFYLPVALVALATSPLWGAAAGALAAALYCLAVVAHAGVPSADLLTTNTLVRLITYSATGVAIGLFAAQNRRLVQELRVLAERDGVTGLPNTRAFQAAIERRLAGGQPFALLIGDLTPVDRGRAGDPDGSVAASDALRRIGDILGRTLGAGDDLARVGDRAFAVLASLGAGSDAARLAALLERTLAGQGLPTRFGWAVYPHEGDNALALYRAADERLYARKLVSADVPGTPALRPVSAG
jgi:GGDEF domain-containing protein